MAAIRHNDCSQLQAIMLVPGTGAGKKFIVDTRLNSISMSNLTKIVVEDIIHDHHATYYSEGQLVFKCLQLACKNSQSIQLSFDGLEDCSLPFLQACIGQLYTMYEADYLDGLISYTFGHIPAITAKIEAVRRCGILNRLN